MSKNKVLLLYVILIFSFNWTNAQSFRQQFDNLDQQSHFQGGAYSWFSNLGSRLKDYESFTMNAYLNMYEATNDMKYLNKFLIHSKRVMNRRDNFIINAQIIYLKNQTL
ncbi:MAG: hypothetical protein RJA07_832 [Bacteroidota bacterium]|jgi:hypothetical protein